MSTWSWFHFLVIINITATVQHGKKCVNFLKDFSFLFLCRRKDRGSLLLKIGPKTIPDAASQS